MIRSIFFVVPDPVLLCDLSDICYLYRLFCPLLRKWAISSLDAPPTVTSANGCLDTSQTTINFGNRLVTRPKLYISNSNGMFFSTSAPQLDIWAWYWSTSGLYKDESCLRCDDGVTCLKHCRKRGGLAYPQPAPPFALFIYLAVSALPFLPPSRGPCWFEVRSSLLSLTCRLVSYSLSLRFVKR